MSNHTQIASKTQPSSQVTINGNGITRVIYKDQPVLTQTGYAMLAKVFTDDLAWQVQRELVNKYFATSQPATPPQAQMLEHARLNKELMALFGINGNMQTLALNNAIRKEFDVNLLENWGVNGLKAETQDQLLTPTDIAERLGMGKRKVNPTLVEAGLQTSNRDHKDRLYYELTDKGLEHGLYLDTGKKHSDATPVRQIKWYASVIEVLKSYLEASFALTGQHETPLPPK